jgi:hypothetical protein
VANPGFTLAEDAALKHRLSAIAVRDDRSTERVAKVFFRYPEGETEKHYPFITIDLLDIDYAPDRQESERSYYFTTGAQSRGGEHSPLYYYPSEYTEADLAAMVDSPSEFLSTDQFVPVNLIYQVTTYARSQQHDRQLTMLLLRRVFPFRRGFIEVPEDGTIRRCDLLDWRNSNVLDQEAGYQKRIFRKVFTVSISAEIPQSDLVGAPRVTEVSGELVDNNTATDVLSPTFSEEF